MIDAINYANSAGKMVALKLDGIEGRFAGMLPPEEVTPETRAMAQALLAAMGTASAQSR